MFWVQSLASQKESFGVLLPPLGSRPSWAVAWAELGMGLGRMEGRAGRGGRDPTNHLLAVLG